ncbi:hypothetical protein CK203_083698 [Vitis vinifera]|uniref:Uncharacterized protein n=1 Tax=Vitis vinifera TaxID=29760 RepID=A0A438CYG8_VITVI|nr:hypothetical protein CK203_083698 [Vitis vinifera]
MASQPMLGPRTQSFEAEKSAATLLIRHLPKPFLRTPCLASSPAMALLLSVLALLEGTNRFPYTIMVSLNYHCCLQKPSLSWGKILVTASCISSSPSSIS